MAQMQEQIKTPETEVINEEIANPSDSEFKTLVIMDAHRNGWVWSQNGGKSEGYTKWNKEKYIGNQLWREGNQDSNQLSGAEEKNEHSTRTEWKTRIQKKWGEAEEPLGQL